MSMRGVDAFRLYASVKNAIKGLSVLKLQKGRFN